MKSFGRTLKYLFVILLLAAAGAAVVAYKFWTQSDELLREQLAAHFQRVAPDLEIRFGRCRHDLFRRIKIDGASIRLREQNSAILTLPQTIITIDRDELVDRQDVVVQKVVLRKPTLELVREHSGRWNWEGLSKLLTASKRSLPEFQIEQGTLTIRLNPLVENGLPPTTVTLTDADLRFVPSGKRQFVVSGQTRVSPTSKLKLDGKWNVDGPSGTLDGELDELSLESDLFAAATELVPRFREQLVVCQAKLQSIRPNGGGAGSAPFSMASRSSDPSRGPSAGATTDPLDRDSDNSTATWPDAGPPFSTANAPFESALPATNVSLSGLGVAAAVKVNFHIQHAPENQRPEFRVLLNIARGEITNPLLPFPLYDLSGKLYLDRERIIVGDLVAQNGSTQLKLNGTVAASALSPTSERLSEKWEGEAPAESRTAEKHGSAGASPSQNPASRIASDGSGSAAVEIVGQGRRETPTLPPSGDDGPADTRLPKPTSRLHVEITDLACDQRLRDGLPDQMRRVYDMLQTSGRFDVTATVEPDAAGVWHWGGLVATAKGMSAAHVAFPYLIEDIIGTITQRGRDLQIDLRGSAGRRSITVTGFVQDPLHSSASVFDVRVDGLALDQSFVDACQPELRSTLTLLNLTGTLDAHLRLVRPAGPQQPYQKALVGYVNSGSLRYQGFPYRIDNLTGKVTWLHGDWTFTELQGLHNGATLTGAGKYVKTAGVSVNGVRTNAEAPHGVRPEETYELDLTVSAEQAPFDDSLRLALPSRLQQVWDEFTPSGTLNLTSTIHWQTGRPAVIALPKIELVNGGTIPKMFPYSIEQLHATGSYADDELTIASLEGAHGSTRLRLGGRVNFDDRGDWTTRFENLTVENLTPDKSFRNALPEGLRDVFACLDSEQTVSMLGMLELRGTARPQDAVTAAWDIETVFADGTFTSGLEFEHVDGRMRAQGTWNGKKTDVFFGRIDLQTATVLGYRLADIRGPFHVKDSRLIVGSEQAVTAPATEYIQQPVDARSRVTANVIGGVLTLDAILGLHEVPEYHVRLNLSQGDVEQYAKLYMSGQHNLQGTLNGWVELHGQGSQAANAIGRGQLQIRPASLYQLPVVVQIFKVLSHGPPDKAAFNYAWLDFDIADAHFLFKRIDLVGSPITLRGRGHAGFDGRLRLDFYSKLPPNQLPISIVKVFLDEATKGWVGVEVTGTVQNPVGKIKPAANLDGALKNFLNALPPLVPPLNPPPSASGPLRGRGTPR